MSEIGHSRCSPGKQRGGNPPACLRFSAQRGVTLIELMISMLILAIVCMSWLEIIGIQSARKEARRREAVERLSGMMDAFLYCNKNEPRFSSFYRMSMGSESCKFNNDADKDVVYPLFESATSPIGYQLAIVNAGSTEVSQHSQNWGGFWLVGRLYNTNGNVSGAGKPFFTLTVRLWK